MIITTSPGSQDHDTMLDAYWAEGELVLVGGLWFRIVDVSPGLKDWKWRIVRKKTGEA